MPVGKEPLNDVETLIRSQCGCCRTRRLRGGERLGVKERRNICRGWGMKAEEGVGYNIIFARDVLNVLYAKCRSWQAELRAYPGHGRGAECPDDGSIGNII